MDYSIFAQKSGMFAPAFLEYMVKKKIQMVDLLGQYSKIGQEVDQAIQNVVRSSAYINGPEVKSFQKELEEYLGVKHVIPCGNGTDALQMAIMALGLKPGDEVITTNFTFIATVEVVALLGVVPVIVDVDPETFNMDPESVRKNITSKTKAIVPVHLFGQCANMEELMKISKEHDIAIIEDNAQAIAADYTFSDGTKKKAGTIGHIGTTSFFPSKNLGCYGDGGALMTNDDDLAEKIRQIGNHGMKVRYYHDVIGVNSRLDSIQAAVLRIKLRELDNYCDARRQAADIYDELLSGVEGITTPVRDPQSTHVFHQYTLKIEGVDRNALRDFLGEHEIPAMIYYPVPLHLQKAFLHLGYKEGDFPVTESLCHVVMSLPMHTELERSQQEFITDKIKSFYDQNYKS